MDTCILANVVAFCLIVQIRTGILFFLNQNIYKFIVLKPFVSYFVSLYAFIVRNFSCKVFYDNFTSLESSLISRLYHSWYKLCWWWYIKKKLLMVSLNILTSHCSSIGFFSYHLKSDTMIQRNEQLGCEIKRD